MKPGYATSEFFALFLAHALVPIVLLIKPEIVDSTVVMTLIGADITYGVSRSGIKAVVANKGASPTAADLADALINKAKENPK